MPETASETMQLGVAGDRVTAQALLHWHVLARAASFDYDLVAVWRRRDTAAGEGVSMGFLGKRVSRFVMERAWFLVEGPMCSAGVGMPNDPPLPRRLDPKSRVGSQLSLCGCPQKG